MPVSAFTIAQTDESQMNGKEVEIQQVSVAANETVGAEGQTIMIIQADENLDASQVQSALHSANIQELSHALEVSPESVFLRWTRRVQLL